MEIRFDLILIWFDLIFFCIHVSIQFFDNNTNIKYNKYFSDNES